MPLIDIFFFVCSLECTEEKIDFIDKAVIGICDNAQNAENVKYLWTFSMHSQIICRKFLNQSNESEIVANYSTLPIGMYTIRECPHDLNK